MLEVLPALLEQDTSELQNKINLVKGKVDRVHLDIMDGEFVPNTTINDPIALSKLDWGELKVAVHLMIARPTLYIKKWCFDPIDLVYVHVEAVENLEENIRLIKEQGRQVGLVINPHTPTYEVKEVLDKIDSVMFMGVEPGFSAQAFNADILEKIKYLRELSPDMHIIADGGVSDKTVGMLRQAGVTAVCANSYIFKSDNLEESIASLQQ